MGRFCAACLVVAGLSLAAAALRAGRRPAEHRLLLASLLLGAGAGWFAPCERLDYAATRRLWPAKLLSDLPPIVSSADAFACTHASPVRLLLYEKDCRG
jgi:hypothetical protein